MNNYKVILNQKRTKKRIIIFKNPQKNNQKINKIPNFKNNNQTKNKDKINNNHNKTQKLKIKIRIKSKHKTLMIIKIKKHSLLQKWILNKNNQ